MLQQRARFGWLLFHRLAKFHSICSSFLFLAARSRNKVKRAGLTRTITLWISEDVLRADISFLFFLFASIFSRSPSLTNFFSLVLLFIATAFEAIFTSVSLPGLAILTPAFPLTCFVTHNYSLKLTPTSLLPGVYWNFIPFSTIECVVFSVSLSVHVCLFICFSRLFWFFICRIASIRVRRLWRFTYLPFFWVVVPIHIQNFFRFN